MPRNTAKLFMHGRSQAVRLPKEFRMEGTEVEIWREGEVVKLKPMSRAPASWKQIFSELKNMPDVEGFMEDRAQDVLPLQPKNLIDED
jgi:antitoxin VapB